MYRHTTLNPMTLLTSCFLCLLLGLSGLPNTVFAQSDADLMLLDRSAKAFSSVVKKAGPAVVHVSVEKETTVKGLGQFPSDLFNDPFFERFFGPQFRHPRTPSKPEKRTFKQQAAGSGFIITSDGYILTNNHVIEETNKITVRLADKREFAAKVIGADPQSDVAVLKIDAANLPVIPLGNSDNLEVGEWVIAIGNPFGNMMRDPQPSVSVGVVSATHRRVSREIGQGERFYQDLIQTDAAINPGNSGGPLINALGEVVGVNTMIFSNTGGYQGLGFAIPASRVRRIVDELLTHGRRRSPWFGFRGQAVEEVSPHVLRRLDVSAESGVLVTEVFPASAADEAGLQPGDVVVRINGEAVAHPTDVDFINWGLFVGDQATFGLNRAGKALRVPLTVREYR